LENAPFAGFLNPTSATIFWIKQILDNMLDQVPFPVDLLFILTSLVAVTCFVAAILKASTEKARSRAHTASLLLLMWMIFQSTLSLNRWYMDREAMPPNLFFPLITMGSTILLLFALPRGRRFIDAMNAEWLMAIHFVRIPVEITLYLLATWKQVPWSMTMAGMNYDLLSGVSALFIWWFGYRRPKLSKGVLLFWHTGALALLVLVVIRGVGAVPSPMQSWDFNQPNYAVQHFPYIWLPSVIVPLVLFSHLVLIRRLIRHSAPAFSAS